MNYVPRTVQSQFDELFDIFPIVAITGPRQAGKSTLIKHSIDNSWNYFSFDNRELLLRIKSDPTLFVKSLKSNVAIDEAQKCPELFHSIKELVDEGFPHKILLSGSANFLLMQSITESLAGRVGLLELLPFSIAEYLRIEPLNLVDLALSSTDIHQLYDTLSANLERRIPDDTVIEFILHGGYPKITQLNSAKARTRWFQNYISTYLERDLRELAQVADLDTFQRVYQLTAYQNGGMVNMSSVASDVGVTVQTIKRYISILETSYQVQHLPAYIYNQRKQILKTPKIYYVDSGLVNHFHKNQSSEEMLSRGDWGGTLEGHVLSELVKEIKDMAPRPNLYYWRTNNGAEVDFIIEQGDRLIPVEVKSGIHIRASGIRGLKSFADSQSHKQVPFRLVIYRGDEVVFINEDTLAIPLGMVF